MTQHVYRLQKPWHDPIGGGGGGGCGGGGGDGGGQESPPETTAVFGFCTSSAPARVGGSSTQVPEVAS